MKQWWRGLHVRERWLLVAAGMVLGSVILHGLVWTPWQQTGEELRQRIEQAEEDLLWMRQAVLHMPVATARSHRDMAGGNPVTLMNRVIGQIGLRDRMKQMKPLGKTSVRMRFEEAAFDSLLQLLGKVESEGMAIRELRITPADRSGRVNATLVVGVGV